MDRKLSLDDMTLSQMSLLEDVIELAINAVTARHHLPSYMCEDVERIYYKKW